MGEELASEIAKLEEAFASSETAYNSIICIKDCDDVSDAIDKAEYYREKHLLKYSNDLDALLANEDYQSELMESDALDNLLGHRDAIFDAFDSINLHIARLVSESNKKVLRRTRDGFVNQLSVFSIVLAVLSFILNNAKLLSYESLSFPMLMAGNIGFILMCLVMFALIYYFLHVDEGVKKFKKKLSLFLVTVLILCALIYGLVAIDKNNHDVPLVPTDISIPVGPVVTASASTSHNPFSASIP